MSGALVFGICTFNRGRAFTPTLEALARLDRANGRLVRIVIVNNASTDDTADVVRAFAQAHPTLPLNLIDEPTPGKLHAMRRLFASTHEPFVAIIDDDTIPDPQWATRLLALMDEHPACGVAGGPVINHWEKGPTRLARIYRRSLGDFDLGPKRLRLDRPDSFLLGASLLCRRAAIEASGWLQGSKLAARTGTDLQSGAEDAELCIRVRQTLFAPRPTHPDRDERFNCDAQQGTDQDLYAKAAEKSAEDAELNRQCQSQPTNPLSALGAPLSDLCVPHDPAALFPSPFLTPRDGATGRFWEIWYEPAATMQHLIPARRQTPEYLARLRGDVERSMPSIAWVAGLVPGQPHAGAQLARAKRRYWKTLLFDWRPTRRQVRLAERRGRIEGWKIVQRRIAGDA